VSAGRKVPPLPLDGSSHHHANRFKSSAYVYPDALWVTSLSPGVGSCTAVCTYSNYVYAGCYPWGIYCSSDQGSTWNNCYSDKTTEWVGCSAGDDGMTVFFMADGDSDNLFRSTNYGADWSQLTSVSCTGPTSVATNTGDGQIVYVLCEGDTDNNYIGSAIYASFNGGDTFEVHGANGGAYWDVALSSDGDYAYYTYFGAYVECITDASEEYSQESVCLFKPSNVFTGVATDEYGTYVFAGTTAQGIWMSSDSGGTFTQASTLSNYWSSISCSQTGEYVFVADTSGGIYVSTDYGDDWSESTTLSGASWNAIATSITGQYTYAAGTNSDGQGIIYFLNAEDYAAPTSTPTTNPSAQPSSKPSTSPSSLPTSIPSVTPTAAPSYKPHYNVTSGTLISTELTKVYSFTNLNLDVPIYVTAELLVSYLDVSSGGFIVINTGNESAASMAVGQASDSSSTVQILSSDCAPTQACTKTSTVTCVSNALILSGSAGSANGGTLTLVASVDDSQVVSGTVSTPCTYAGINDVKFAITYTLSSYLLATSRPTHVPTASSTSSTNTNNSINILQSKTIPFDAIAAVIVVFVVVAVAVVRLRDQQQKSTKLGLVRTTASMALLGYHLMSEIFYVIFLAEIPPSEGLRYLFIIIVIARLLSLLPTCYFILLLFGPDSLSKHYLRMINEIDLRENLNTYAVMLTFMFVDQNLVVYLPWLHSEFAELSSGYPDDHVFRIATSVRLIQLSMSIIVQVFVFHYNSGNLIAAEGYNEAVISLLYFVASVLVFIVTVIAIFIRTRMLMKAKGATSPTSSAPSSHDTGEKRESSTVANPMRALSVEDDWNSSSQLNLLNRQAFKSTEGMELSARMSHSQHNVTEA
jgi:frataxin-like iron-binding protein CyaY